MLFSWLHVVNNSADCFLANKDYPGGDIKCKKRKSAFECDKLCKQTEKCAKFTYFTNNFPVKSRRNQCCLKANKHFATVELKGAISGPRICGKSLFINGMQSIILHKHRFLHIQYDDKFQITTVIKSKSFFLPL